MLKNKNLVDQISLVSFLPGILFILVYIIPISEKIFGIIGYLACILVAILVIFRGRYWGLKCEYSIFPSVGVLFSSIQIILRILFDFSITFFLISSLIFCIDAFCVIYIFKKWRTTPIYSRNLVIKLLLGSLIVLGILTIYSILWNTSKNLDYFVLWIIYSFTIIIFSIALSFNKQINAWIIAVSLMPFIIMEIFPYTLPSSITAYNFQIINYLHIILYTGFLFVIPLLVYFFEQKKGWDLFILLLIFVILYLVVYSKWLVYFQSIDEILPFRLMDVTIINVMLVYMPVIILATMGRKSQAEIY